MKRQKYERVVEMIADVEALAKRLQADFRKAAIASGLDKRIHGAAKQLRRQAVRAAEGVEKLAHQVRVGLRTPRRHVSKRANSKAST